METIHEILRRFGDEPQMVFLSTTVARLVVAAILGGIIGIEREMKHKPAGLRTNMFICFGAAMFTILSDQLALEHLGDHTRIAAQIIPGIGFIGAGSIMRSGANVTGLTSAATLFVVASIGMATGGGLYLPAIFATIIVLVSLEVLGVLERKFNLKPEVMKYEVIGAKVEEMISEINAMLEHDHRMMDSVEVAPHPDGFRVQFGLFGTRAEHRNMLAKLQALGAFKKVAFLGTRERG